MDADKGKDTSPSAREHISKILARDTRSQEFNNPERRGPTGAPVTRAVRYDSDSGISVTPRKNAHGEVILKPERERGDDAARWGLTAGDADEYLRPPREVSEIEVIDAQAMVDDLDEAGWDDSDLGELDLGDARDRAIFVSKVNGRAQVEGLAFRSRLSRRERLRQPAELSSDRILAKIDLGYLKDNKLRGRLGNKGGAEYLGRLWADTKTEVIIYPGKKKVSPRIEFRPPGGNHGEYVFGVGAFCAVMRVDGRPFPDKGMGDMAVILNNLKRTKVEVPNVGEKWLASRNIRVEEKQEEG